MWKYYTSLWRPSLSPESLTEDLLLRVGAAPFVSLDPFNSLAPFRGDLLGDLGPGFSSTSFESHNLSSGVQEADIRRLKTLLDMMIHLT